MSMMDVVAPLAALALIAAALHDVVARTIPNAIPAFVALLGLALRAAEGDLAWGLLAFVLVFAVAVIAWRYHVMGGGDVKLLAACALLPAPGSVADMMVAIALAGGALSLFYLAFRGRRPLPIPPRRRRQISARQARRSPALRGRDLRRRPSDAGRLR